MGWRSTIYASAPHFVVDPEVVARNSGRQIDWDKVTNAYLAGVSYTVQTNDANAKQGDTTITMDALPVALPLGAVLDFGTLAADAIPSGTVLKFGADEFAELTADAAAGATSLTVAALAAQIESADTANYPGVAQRMLVQLTAAADAAATSITVAPLPAPVPDNSTATYKVSMSREKVIPAGTVMCELSSGKVVPRAARPGSETAIGFLWSTATSSTYEPNSDSLSGYGIIIGGAIYETLLPETITSYKTELTTAGVGTGFSWHTYADSREV
jgi:hypothetical protein